MKDLVRTMQWDRASSNLDVLVTREWLVTNGLGGYASGTVSGVVTRRFHGLLIAALPSPMGRIMMLQELSEQVKTLEGKIVDLGAEERVGQELLIHGAKSLEGFRLEAGLPVWRYNIAGVVLEKRILLPHKQNTVQVRYKLVSGNGVALRLRPAMHFRPHEGRVGDPWKDSYVITARDERLEVSSGDYPPLRMFLYGEESNFTIRGRALSNVLYRLEENRGYDHKGDLWSPGHFWVDIDADHDATFVASTEPWEVLLALSPDQAQEAELERRRRLIVSADPKAKTGLAAELVLAADQFIITPKGRQEDAARARAAGDDVRTVIAGYHWFTDWGRDTMISLEGLTLSTGRQVEAGWILRTFAQYVRDGLIPNLFPEGEKQGLYHTADATLWFFHALDRYLACTSDHETLRHLLPTLRDIVDHHLRGTRFGICVDPHDGLLHQGEEGYQLTWMDAKVDGWVVTPRRGKAVEINALWYNALRLMEEWEGAHGGDHAADAPRYAEHAQRAYQSFNRRFWYAGGGYLYDVVDSEKNGANDFDDDACRPNQLLAISPRFPVLDPTRWQSVLNVVRDRLLTPVGLRSLAPGHPDYKERYFGDLRSRDAAYHQGTVWAWPIGPFIDAWLKVHPHDLDGARHFLDGFGDELHEACVGSISEVFDSTEPYTPRGCIAQAWSVAEVLRCLIKTAR